VPDPHSFARPDEASVSHVSLDLTPDFASRTLHATARLTVEREPTATELVLDTSGLTITQVADAAGGALPWRLGDTDEVLGAPLTVALPPGVSTVVVDYVTAPDAGALQWLEPPQTAGKELPFLFTQGQAILTRTWIPTQDSPGIRQTYDAAVHVPAGMRAVMSAVETTNADEVDTDGRQVQRFGLDQRVPPYLFALAVGDLAFEPIGPRTGVYAEPSVVAGAAAEFGEVDEMVAAAERLYGPYRWGRFDILVLPPSFPFGGMENPTLTFATPTILAGDRSLVSLVAHEIAHSWSGNLVTNATWDDFWLNEGFTTYIERRIMEELRGPAHADMLRQLGRQELAETMDEVGGPESPDTRLRLDLTGRDPDEGTTVVAYEKGAAFLELVESVVGRQRLDTWLRAYFDEFALQPMTSDRMVGFLRDRLLAPGEDARLDVDAWVDGPGLPPNATEIRGELFAAVERQAEAWNAGAPPSSLSTAAWSTQEWLHFLQSLPRTIEAARLDALDAAFGLSRSGNSEVACAWLLIAIRNRYEPAFPAVDHFLTSQGRRKYVRPIYTALARTDWGMELAREVYERARPTYHPVTSSTVDRVLGVSDVVGGRP
jgi:aminopeptidase N